MDASGTISGPAPFMRSEDFASWKRAMEAGSLESFNRTARLSPSIEIAILVSLQTCYAAWHGRETFLASFDQPRRFIAGTPR